MGAFILIGLYFIAILAGFFGPYNYDHQFRKYSYARPMIGRLHFRGTDGKVHPLHPTFFPVKTTFVDGKKIQVEDKSKGYQLQWFVEGDEYHILGLVGAKTHLLGTDHVEHPLFLLGSDEYGRDILSRLCFGAQISLSIGLLGILLSYSIGITVGGIAGYYANDKLRLHNGALLAWLGFAALLVCQILEIVGQYGSWWWLLLESLFVGATCYLVAIRRRTRAMPPASILKQWGIGLALLIGLRLFCQIVFFKNLSTWLTSTSDLRFLGFEWILLLLVIGCGALWGLKREPEMACLPADTLLMRLVEIIMSLPGLYLILALRGIFPNNLSSVMLYFLVIVIMSFVYWASISRVIRGMVLSLREVDFAQASRAMGAKDMRIILRHILPGTTTFIIVQATLDIPYYILGEVILSFLGVGIQEPYASWGNMLNAARSVNVLETSPWVLLPGLAIFITVMAFNFLGDGLRDALDPRKLGVR